MSLSTDDRRTSGGAHPDRLRQALADLLWRLMPASSRDDLRTELDLEYRTHVRPARSAWGARRWYARQFFGSLIWNLKRHHNHLPAPRRKSSPMDSLMSDLRFAARSFRRTRGITLIAVLTIAVGVGASTTVYSVLDAVILRPLPYPDSARMVQLWHDGVVSKGVMSRVIERVSTLDPVAGSVTSRRTLTGDFDPEELSGAEVTAGYWDLFGMRPARGALPRDVGTDPGQEPVVVISHRLWQRKFGGEPDIVGKTIRLGDEAVTVVGVVEESFTPLSRSTDFWTPMLIDTADFSDYEGVGQVSIYGRLADGVALEAATADARAAAGAERESVPDAYSENWVARSAPRPLHDVLVQDTRVTLWTTMGAVLLVLLIACANVANLLLARSSTRRREIAVRMGLGAARGRIIRQMLTESLLLALAGGALGGLLAAVATAQLGAAWLGLFRRVDALHVDAGMLLFALAITALAALLFGIAPALRASSVAPRAHLADGGNAGTSAKSRRLSSLLVGAEVALSVLLVIGAGLMLRTVSQLVSVDPGFSADQVTTFRLRIPEASEDGQEAQHVAFIRRVRESLSGLPGVEQVGATSGLPMSGGAVSAVYWIAGEERPDDQPPENAAFQLVTGDYFGALRMTLQRGRSFDASDAQREPVVAVINETMARTTFGDEDPIGRRIVMFGGTELEIIGVVADSRQRSPDRAPDPEVFLPFDAAPFWPTMFLVMRSAGPPPSADVIRAAVWQVNDDVPLLDLSAMEDVVASASGRTRLFARTLTGFGFLAMLLAGVGVYGVTSHTLGAQVHEFGIRLALGATAQDVVRTALRRSLVPVLVGAIIGVAGAGALSRLLQGLLFGVSPLDVPTYVVVPALLILVGTAAAYLPARRAARVDPKESLNAG